MLRWSHILQRGQAHSGSNVSGPTVRMSQNLPAIKEAVKEAVETISTLLGSTASYGDGDVPGGKLGGGRSSVMASKGRVVRGYRSALDDSVQPVRVTVPKNMMALGLSVGCRPTRTIYQSL